MSPVSPTGSFRERLLPGLGPWLGVLAFAAGLGVALWPINATIAVAVAAVGLVVGIVALWAFAPVIAVTDGQLHAGPATIPVEFLGTTRTLDADGVRELLGPGSDARAYICLRTSARFGVRVDLVDPQDPTPYWLISTRHPEELATALLASRPEPV